MFDIVLMNLVENKDSSDRIIALCNLTEKPIRKTIYDSYQTFISSYTGDLNELSNAAEVTEGVYAQMGVELGI